MGGPQASLGSSAKRCKIKIWECLWAPGFLGGGPLGVPHHTWVVGCLLLPRGFLNNSLTAMLRLRADSVSQTVLSPPPLDAYVVPICWLWRMTFDGRVFYRRCGCLVVCFGFFFLQGGWTGLIPVSSPPQDSPLPVNKVECDSDKRFWGDSKYPALPCPPTTSVPNPPPLVRGCRWGGFSAYDPPGWGL